MGCICSKAITRSMSIREELNHGFQTTNIAWEEMFASNNGNDKLFAIPCSAKTGTNELRASSFVSPSIDDDLGTKYFVKALDLIPDIKRAPEVKSSPEFDGELEKHGKFTRSKSYQMSREKEQSGLSFETTEELLNENKLDWRDKNLRGSRSFHTVEDYDALLERIYKSNTGNIQFLEEVHSSHQSKSLDGDQSVANVPHEDFLKNETGIEESKDLNKGSLYPATRESGWRRKAAAKGLESLDVSAIEFPPITRVRQWTQAEGQVYSPGTYVTPKFGSYNNMNTEKSSEDEGGNDTVFNPELMAAFEDCVQQLQIEEDSILCYMEGYVRINNLN